MQLHISGPYLWLPVDQSKPEVKLHFYADGKKIQEIDMHLGGTDGDFYTCMEVGAYLGMDMEIKADTEEDRLYGIFCYGQKVQNVYPFRPKLHFSPEIGWHNDPNGLVYANGQYHLYYQWNPYGVTWGNMHWGHAVSQDLLHWEHEPSVMAPDESGSAYSGCAWADHENHAGYGEQALLFYYTAAGGRNEWSIDAGNTKFTQRLAVSLDGGKTLQKSNLFLMEHIAGENRDPKIFYHKESSAYIMVLYLDGHEFAVFRSKHLLHWEETQRFSIEGMWECPDLFELCVEPDGREKKWVFWSADGYYVVGDFDGYRFFPQSDVLHAYGTKLPYAAQTYAGVADRVISIAWLRMDNSRGNYRGLMSLPAELSLAKQGQDYRIRLWPVRELAALRRPYGTLASGQRQVSISLRGEPLEVLLSWKREAAGQTRLLLGNTAVVVDFAEESIRLCGMQEHSDIVNISFSHDEALSLRIIIDQEVMELFGNGGMIYAAVETEENVLRKILLVESSAEMESMEWYEL